MKSSRYVLLCVAALFLYVLAHGQHRESVLDSLEKDIQQIKNAFRQTPASAPATDAEVQFMHDSAAHGAHRMHAAENAQSSSEDRAQGFMDQASEQVAMLKHNVEEQLDAISTSLMNQGQSSSASLLQQVDQRLNALRDSVWSSSSEPGVQEWFGRRLTDFQDTLAAAEGAPAELKDSVVQRLTEMTDSFHQHLTSMKDKVKSAASDLPSVDSDSDSDAHSHSLKEKMGERLHSLTESIKNRLHLGKSAESPADADVDADFVAEHVATSAGPLMPVTEVDEQAALVDDEHEARLHEGTVGEQLRQQTDAMNEQLKQRAEHLQDAAGHVKDSVVEGAETAGDFIKEQTRDAKDTLHQSAEQLRDSAEAAGESIKENVHGASASVRQSAEHLRDRAESASESLRERVHDAQGSLRDTLRHSAEHVKRRASAAGDYFREKVGATQASASESAEQLKDRANAAGESVRDRLDNAGDALQRSAHHVSDRVEDASESLAEKAHEAKDSAAETAQHLKHRFEGQSMASEHDSEVHTLGERLGERLGRMSEEVSSAFAATQEAVAGALFKKLPEQLDFTHSHRYLIQSSQTVNGRSVSYSNINGKESLVFDSDIMPSEQGQLDALNSFRKAHGLSAAKSLSSVNVVRHQRAPHHLQIVAARTTNGVGYLYEYNDGEEDISVIGPNAPQEQPNVLELLNDFRKQYGLPERSSLPSKLERKELPQKGEQQATSMLGLSSSPKTEL